jgi:hypothetical protein
MNSRKYPRTTQEAFGPYTSREVLDESHIPFHSHDLIVMAGCLAAVIVLAVLGMFWAF